MEPKVLVLLAARNGEKYIAEQLKSVHDQRGVDVDVLISVDPSDDRTAELVADLARGGSNVEVHVHAESSGGAAQNFYRLILSAATQAYDYVALSDQDDVWMPDKLQRAVSALRSSGASAYSSNVWAWDGDPGMTHLTLVDKAQGQKRWDHLFSSAGPGCTYVFRAPEFQRFAEWLATNLDRARHVEYHDWLLYAWFRAAEERWLIDPEPSMYYRQHSDNQLGANKGLGAVRSRVRDLHNGWFQEQVLRIASLVGQDDEPPVRSLRSRSRRGRLRLLLHAKELRRAKVDSVVISTLAFSSRRRGQ